jgi:hypothetical protein
LAITLVGTFGAGVDTGNLTVTLPAGISFGDAVGAVAICSSSQTLATPAGWSLRSGWPKDGGNARFYAFTKNSVTASDSGASVVFVPSASNKCVVVGFALHSGSGFPVDWTDALNFTAHATTGTSYTAPSSISTQAGDWGVAVFGARGTNPTGWTPAGTLTERQDLARTGSGATSLALYDANGPIGASGTTWGPFTQANISSSNGGALTWLVKQNPAGGGAATPTAFQAALGLNPDKTAAEIATDLDHLQAVGAKVVWVSAAMEWLMAGGPSGDAAALGKLDQVVEQTATRGLPLALQLHGMPTWITAASGHTANTWHGPDTAGERANYVAVVHNLINRYGAAKVQWVEVWNEPNIIEFWVQGPNPADYARLLHDIYLDIKGTWPSIKVVGHNMSRNHIGWLQAVYAQTDAIYGASAAAANRYFFDVLGIHPYCGDSTSGFDPAVENHADESTAFGLLDPDYLGYRRLYAEVIAKEGVAKALAVGEFGYATIAGWFFVAEATRATYLASAMTLARADPQVKHEYFVPYTHSLDAVVDHFTSFNIHNTSTETAYTAAAAEPGGGGGGATGYPVTGLWAEHGGAWRTDMNAAEATYGVFQGHWGQYFPAGQVPLGSTVIQAIADGKRLHVFWKPQNAAGQANDTWAAVASGARDTQLDQAAASVAAVAPAQVWLTLHHEPEDDYIDHGSGGTGWTAANYRGMWSRVRARFDAAGVTNVTWVMVWQNSHSHPAEMLTLWGNDGVMDGLVDIVSQQDYILAGAVPATIATKWLEDLEFLKTNDSSGRHWSYVHKPQAFTEWGADLGGEVRGTNTHRAQTIDAIRDILPDLAARNVVELRYFDARTNVIDPPPSVDGVAFQNLKDATEAGQSAGGITGNLVSLARDGLTATANTIGFVLPSGWQQGDYATVWLSTNSQPDVTVVPAGWVLQEGPVNNSTVQRAWRYSKLLQAGETDPSWTISQSVRPSGVMVVLRGVSGAPVLASSALTATASGTSHAAPAVTVPNTVADVYPDVYSDTYGLAAESGSGTDATVITAWLTRWADASGNGGVSYGTPPGSHTTLGSVSVDSDTNAGAGALVAQLAASPVDAGTYGPYTATFPVASTGICGQLAIAAATVAPPTPGVVYGTATAVFGPLIATANGSGTTPGAPSDLIPDARVEVAFGSQPMDLNPAWTTLAGTGVGAVQAPIVIDHGRGDEFSEVQPGTMSAELRNEDGRYTMGKTTGPYGSGVKVGRRVRATITYQGVNYPRHDGHANGWPTSWPVGGGALAFGELSSTDRLKRLGQVGELRSMLEEETLRDAPAAYYPLGESENATSAGSVTPVPQASAAEWPLGAGGGSVSFGQGTGPGTDELSAAVFSPQSQTSGRVLRANPVVVNAAASGGVTLSAWFNTSVTPAPNAMAIAALTNGAGDDALLLAIWVTGQVQAFYITDGVGIFGNASPKQYNDGRTHQAAVTLSRAASGVVTVRLVVDGVQVQSGTFNRGPLGTFSQLDIGGFHVAGDWAPFSGTLSHVSANAAAVPVSRLLTHYQAGATGLAGDRTDQRIARVADWIGLPATDRALDVGDTRMGAQSTAGKQPLEVMREAAAVEQGVLFVSPAGKLTFHRLSRRYNRTTPDLILDCAAEGHVQVGLVMPGDDFGLVNDMEVGRPGGAAQRAINTASIGEFGLYRDSLEIPAASDFDAQAVGNWRVGNYGTPRPRIPNLTVSLSRLHTVSPSLVAAILRLEISSLVRLVNLPTQAPGTSVDVFVEGWTERIDPGGGWSIELNCSPAEHYRVWQLGVAGFSELGVTTRLAL